MLCIKHKVDSNVTIVQDPRAVAKVELGTDRGQVWSRCLPKFLRFDSGSALNEAHLKSIYQIYSTILAFDSRSIPPVLW